MDTIKISSDGTPTHPSSFFLFQIFHITENKYVKFDDRDNEAITYPSSGAQEK